MSSGRRVLDVGTGPGFVALAAMARGAIVTGADQSPEMVRLARASGVDAVVAPVERLPFEEGAYDAVVAGYLLNHLPRPEVAVSSLGRVLRSGGRFAMTVWDLPEANPALGLFGPVVSELGLEAVVRAQARARYVEVARAAYGSADGSVQLPAGAVLGVATKR